MNTNSTHENLEILPTNIKQTIGPNLHVFDSQSNHGSQKKQSSNIKLKNQYLNNNRQKTLSNSKRILRSQKDSYVSNQQRYDKRSSLETPDLQGTTDI